MVVAGTAERYFAAEDDLAAVDDPAAVVVPSAVDACPPQRTPGVA